MREHSSDFHSNKIATINRSTSISTFIAVSLISFVFLFIICSNIVNVNAKKTIDTDMSKQYISVEIKSGDTLEKIAREYYGPGYSSLKNYIKDIKDVNQMSDDTIYSGGYIIIPQYVTVSANY